MAFKKAQPSQNVPDSPEKILLDLPRRRIPGVLLHQGEVLKAYVASAIDPTKAPDVALQLPTGSGKTLVGLLLAEWRRRKFKERVVYLCPTNQLVNQVAEQADKQYGLTVNAFTGRASNFDPTAKSEYQSADRIAVTSYSALFNTNPYFDNAQIIIVDDAHAAENYISSLWTVKIDRTDKKHKTLHAAVVNLLTPFLGSNFDRINGEINSMADITWVDKLPTPYLNEIHNDLISVIDSNIAKLDISYSWSMIRDHVLACHVYLTPNDILIKPLIPPTWSHAPFTGAEQRIFMSATLGLGGDLERLTGRKNILRLPIPEGWDKQGIGRRFFMFPSMSLSDENAVDLRNQLMMQAGRSVILVPSNSIAREVTDQVTESLGFSVFNADDIEESKEPFIAAKQAVAVIAGRYDGIDFPGNDCRLLFVDGLPKATNSQERFLMSKMAANVLFNDRIQTRVLQAIGRCTRSLEDFSTVVVSGEELSNYLTDIRRRSYLHPELQAELDFGIEQSKGTSNEDFFENFKIFLKNGKEWEKNANEVIVAKRESAEQKSFPAIKNLSNAVLYEITYQKCMWQQDYSGAYTAAENVLAELDAKELIGYRALWHYLAGSAAQLGGIKGKDRMQYANAKKAATGISWLVGLAHSDTPTEEHDSSNSILITQLERVEAILETLGLSHSRKFNEREKEILNGLEDKDQFEQAHVLLGQMLGYSAGKEESDGSPDPWWHVGKICFVFEDNAGAESDILAANKARQASTHPDWIRDRVVLDDDAVIISVLVTQKTKAKSGAMPHLKKVLLWELNDFKKWARNALAILRELRTKFSEAGDLGWRAEAMEIFKQNGLDATSLMKKLKGNIAAEKMEEVK
ncbi:DEAD/DEAH box helicase family protein [Fulvivirgaceae bacterium PWU5]|uniref:DEAD/DEAH box helicase family protein n=1 Tax=Dawidia cretensis TaxID=2782350 RepID=A0AAP2E0Z3_9BACT|nr:DEAD/DEAH box helicase [Dawidia cretensis]MBT1710755.1 DEAD/DEAH box helicase family protein [Dawidia cretensis]